MKPINQTHIAQIKIAQKALNMAEEDYRTMLGRVAGVQSATQLDMPGFAAVMAEFNRLGFESTAEHERRMEPKRAPGHATYAQKLKMQRLWDAWKGHPDKPGLRRWLKFKWGVDNLKFLSSEIATKAIGALLHFKKGETCQQPKPHQQANQAHRKTRVKTHGKALNKTDSGKGSQKSEKSLVARFCGF